MSNVNWDSISNLGALRAVIDPNDSLGFKNKLIDTIHWNAIKRDLKGTTSCLDFGCGTGRFAKRITDLQIKYTGIDSSIGMINKAKKVNNNYGLNFMHFDGLNIPFSDNSFDTCLCVGVFCYVINSLNGQKVLDEIKRILIPGGHLIMVEQASLLNQTPEAASRAFTETNYINELSKNFRIKTLRRVRSCQFQKLSQIFIKVAQISHFVFTMFLNRIAQNETRRTLSAHNSYFSKVQYYDIFINALVIK